MAKQRRKAHRPPRPSPKGGAAAGGQPFGSPVRLGPQVVRPRSISAQGTGTASISACIIARNEEEHLGRCLASLDKLVDEVVVVDTGSTDRTRDIALEHGATLLEFPWCDDFSAARNFALQAASGDWLLWVDADEELVEEVPGALRFICEHMPPSHDGSWITCRNLTGDRGEVGIVARQWRLLRGGSGIQFHGRIHEQLACPDDRPALLSSQNGVHVRHWGYLPRPDVLRRKSERNHHLLDLAIAEEPQSVLHRFNRALQYSSEGRYAEGLSSAMEAIELWRRNPVRRLFIPSLFTVAAFSAVHLGEYEKALEIEAEAPPDLRSADLIYSAGIARWRLGRADEAIQALDRAAHDDSLARGGLHELSTSTWRPLAVLGGIHDSLGQYAKGYDYALEALALAPDHPELLFGAADLAHKAGKPHSETLDLLRRLLDGSQDGGYKAHGRRLMLTIADETGDASLALEALSGPAHGVSEAESASIRERARAHLKQTIQS